VDPNLIHSTAGRAIRTPTGDWAFVPRPLNEAVVLDSDVVAQLSLADQKLGKLEGVCHRLPNPHLLSGAYTTREAVLSSEIEGTQATQSDLYLFDLDPTTARNPDDDVREVHNYVRALEHAIRRRADLPLSLRLLREVHEILLRGVRGDQNTPGEFRRSQNWINGPNPEQAEYVPPPVAEMHTALDELEKFLHRPLPARLPVLIETALVHYQFESIHPFLDGNGRTGRLLSTLLLIERGVLTYPVLYLSAYLMAHRKVYLAQLSSVRRTGSLMQWLLFFLTGIAEDADDGVRRAGRILELEARYRQLPLKPTARLLAEDLLRNPYVTIRSVSASLHVSEVTASAVINNLRKLDILRPVYPGRLRKQVYCATEIVDVYSMPRA
jgi:Fic family protein